LSDEIIDSLNYDVHALQQKKGKVRYKKSKRITNAKQVYEDLNTIPNTN
jgi:hypothetical protein